VLGGAVVDEQVPERHRVQDAKNTTLLEEELACRAVAGAERYVACEYALVVMQLDIVVGVHLDDTQQRGLAGEQFAVLDEESSDLGVQASGRDELRLKEGLSLG
jgi:hypothetical protein